MSSRLLLSVLHRSVVLFRNVCMRLRLRLRVALIVFLNEGARIFAGHGGVGMSHGLAGSAGWRKSKSQRRSVFRLFGQVTFRPMSKI